MFGRRVRSIIDNQLATHVFSRQTTLTAASLLNSKAFLVLQPVNDPQIIEKWLTVLVGIDSYVEKTSRAINCGMETTLEFIPLGNPLYYRINWLYPRRGGVPKSASTIPTLLTNDDTQYGQTTSLATSLMNSLYDSPSVTRNYRIKTTRWKKLGPVTTGIHRYKMFSKNPKYFDNGSDTIGNEWLYLAGTHVPVIEFKGFQGDDSIQFNNTLNVPATNNVLTAYQDVIGGTMTTESLPTHINVASSVLCIRRYDRINVKLANDEVREVYNVIDVAPNGNKPILNTPFIQSYLAAV